MKKVTLVVGIITGVIISLLFANQINAQDKVDESQYRAYLDKDPNPQVWRDAVKARHEDFRSKSGDSKIQYALAVAQFGLLSSTMRSKDENLFDEYYDQTVENIKAIQDKNWAEPHALLSAVYGVKMGYSPMQGMFLGSKSNSLVEKAKTIDPNSPFAWKVYANSKYFTPELWGGNLTEAIASYEKCIQLYESKPEQLKFNWLYLDALAFQGQAYLKNGDKAKAIATYEKALKAEPEFSWVKYSLLPKARGAK